MKLRTLSRTVVCLLALLVGCGDDDSGTPADRTERFERTPLRELGESGTVTASLCKRVHPPEVAVAVRRRGTRLEATPNHSLDLSMCQWRGRGVRVQMIADSAPRAQLRYYNQLSEQLQFHNPDPGLRPRQLRGIGDDGAYGGAGAWWTRSTKQLVAYAKKRILRVRVIDESIDDRARQRAAAQMARLAIRRLSEPAS